MGHPEVSERKLADAAGTLVVDDKGLLVMDKSAGARGKGFAEARIRPGPGSAAVLSRFDRAILLDETSGGRERRAIGQTACRRRDAP
jgi:hypothetical protein